MTNVGISLAIIFGTGFCAGVLWLAWEAVSAKPVRPWDDFADRINTVPQSYQEAVEMVITEEVLTLLHEGKPK